MTFLVDTNIFLEILLGRAKKESCKGFLEKNMGELSITDFSLHSIGVILFRYHKKALFDDFIKDVMPKVDLLSLPLKAIRICLQPARVLAWTSTMLINIVQQNAMD